MKTTSSPRTSATRNADEIRTGLTAKAIAADFRQNLYYVMGRFPAVATRNDRYMALAYTVRDRMLHRWLRTAETYFERGSRTVCYLSAEFLLGPQLANNLVNLGIMEETRVALRTLEVDLDVLLEHEEEPGLGNGGLGRLAACYLDSMATLEIPSIGYGIRYEFGIFQQQIRDGWQVEVADRWLRLGNPWEIARPEITFNVKFGGRTEATVEDGRYCVRWLPDQVVRGMAYDTPVLGYGVSTANLLRLWKAEAAESFNLQAFNTGDYYGAVLQKVVSENITKVLYPNDDSPAGKQLRLQQQYFFASCSLQDMIRLHTQRGARLEEFDHKFAVQLNDTHPAIAVAELMRLLVDEHGMDWDPAWRLTQNTFGYTNHTLLPEALEKWSVPLFGSLLPRLLEIIYEINDRFLKDVRARHPDDEALAARVSLIDESGPRYVRMAHLACVGSHAVNGVARLHSELLQKGVLRDFYELSPTKFTNKTNGVTPRRFVLVSNPGLADLLNETIGIGWARNLDDLRRLEPFAEDPAFRQRWREVKRRNKVALAGLLERSTGIGVNPDSLFDVHVKRLHEYKRQHLNLLHIVTLYNRMRRDPRYTAPARTFIFGAKAAPGYHLAKLIIKLVHCVADVVNNDPSVADRLKVVFLPNFNVKNAQWIYPAADLSEQISTAGKEASGTGNMKFSLNGALTIGTLDGANIEIREHVGPENFFLFGLTADEVQATHDQGYDPEGIVRENAELREVLDQIASGEFSPGHPDLFRGLVDGLRHHDEYRLLADFASYVECQDRAGRTFLDHEQWTRMSILNTARMGYFSSDRAIREYCHDIWKVEPEPTRLAD